MMKIRVLMVMLVAGLHPDRGWTDDIEWKATFGRVDITPTTPVFLAGYASRDKPHDQVEAPLFAKALVLEDREGKSVVWITTDLIGFSGAVSDPIVEKIRAETGLARSDILINSSHTHTGPSLTLDPGGRGGQKQVDYTRGVQEQMARLAIEVHAGERVPVELRHGEGVANFVMNRREWTKDRGIVLGVNPRGPVDRSVPVLRISRAGTSEILGVIFQAACHNTTLGGSYFNITGDYAGYAQTALEEAIPGMQAMFMIGCGGDANPYPRDNSVESSRKHGKDLAAEVLRVLEEGKRLRPVAGPLKTAFSVVKLPLEPLPSKADLSRMKLEPGGWRGWVADEMGKYHEPGSAPFPDWFEAPFSVWQFGDDLTLVGLSGEVVVDYVRLLEREIGGLNLWLSAYCHEVYGYLPSARVIREGGYETRGLYHGVGFFPPEVETVVVKEVRKLAVEAGREVPTLD